ncbi:MAG: hypothetical protein M3O01_06890 [Pseudomonadota bacterium]|nr:hypothetical protein [Pseudomonadota bacterium]
MRDFEDSTLWRVSEFERVQLQTGGSGFARLGGPTVLPTTLLADLRQLEQGRAGHDALEVAAACVRHREPALLCLGCDGLVWPITLFPQQMLYHAPRALDEASATGLGSIALLGVEPPGVRPPGHWMHERIAATQSYRPLEPLLWALALRGPRSYPLDEIAGTVAYRALKPVDDAIVMLGGAQRSAAQRLRRETVALRDIASWPGMSVERASRLLNGLYLTSALLATRAHPAARAQPAGLLGRWRNGPRT